MSLSSDPAGSGARGGSGCDPGEGAELRHNLPGEGEDHRAGVPQPAVLPTAQSRECGPG